MNIVRMLIGERTLFFNRDREENTKKDLVVATDMAQETVRESAVPCSFPPLTRH